MSFKINLKCGASIADARHRSRMCRNNAKWFVGDRAFIRPCQYRCAAHAPAYLFPDRIPIARAPRGDI